MAFYVTTPIYYVNAEPHLGHAYTTIAADVLARHRRQRGEEVFFLTGTDEHGEPVSLAAEAQGTTPRELADRNSQRFRDLAGRVNASHDFFIRTSDPEHVAAVQEVLQRVYDAGHVYPGTYEGWYCPRCADFKTEGELLEGDRCPIHKIVLTREKEDNYFFRLSAFQEPLERLFAERPSFVMPESRFNEARSFIRGGLNDISLSRANLTWGVPVPWDRDQVFYVWFDALLNYWTALTYARPGENLTETFWPASVHVMAKDILKFHAVFWPALLLAAGLEVPERCFVHGYLLMDEEKMSKSLGNVIDPFQVMDLYGVDALRFYLLREVSLGQDGSVSPEGFEARYTTELANEFGNLVNRTLAMIRRYRDGVIPKATAPVALAADLDELPLRVRERFDALDVSGALEEIWGAVRTLNRYLQDEQPWQLAKTPAEAPRLDQVLHAAAEGLRVVALVLHPYLPTATDHLLTALGEDERGLEQAQLGARPGGRAVAELAPLFPRVEPPAPAPARA
jgi:methionyl-tRNA synthetase